MKKSARLFYSRCAFRLTRTGWFSALYFERCVNTPLETHIAAADRHIRSLCFQNVKQHEHRVTRRPNQIKLNENFVWCNNKLMRMLQTYAKFFAHTKPCPPSPTASKLFTYHSIKLRHAKNQEHHLPLHFPILWTPRKKKTERNFINAEKLNKRRTNTSTPTPHHCKFMLKTCKMVPC